jgi:hypothetical protein
LIGDQIEIDFCHTNPEGMPHVSLVTDIVQLFGTGSVPVIVGGSVLGVFELGERFASQRAKDALSKWLLTFDVQKTKALPEGTQELFERIFGERHFSWKCFVRSAAFSVGAMVFISIVFLLIFPTEILEMLRRIVVFEVEMESVKVYGDWFMLVLWLPVSILVDYVSLFKTRVILGGLTRLRQVRQLTAIAIVGIDYIVYRFIAFTGILVIALVDNIVNDPTNRDLLSWGIDFINTFMTQVIDGVLGKTFLPFFPTSPQLGIILFWAGFAPSLWLWLYVFALFVTRAILRSEKLVNWLRWGLDVEKNPFRSIGAIAAGLAFIVSVAIILVSVEVSRISTAT